MTDFQSAADAWLTELGGRPAARQPASFGEIADAAWGEAGLNSVFGSETYQADAFDRLEEALRRETGKGARELTGDWGGEATPGLLSPAERGRMVEEALGRLDKGQRERLAPLTDIRKRAAEAAQAEQARADEVWNATFGLSGGALWFMTSLAREAIDPVNVATMPLGGPMKGPVLKYLGREAAIGAGVNLAQFPVVSASREDLGLPTGTAAEAALYGALGQAGFAGILRVGAAALRRVLPGKGAETRQAPAGADAPAEAAAPAVAVARPATAPSRAGSGLSPADFDAAAMVAERQQLLDGAAATPAARAKVPERIDAAAAAVERRGDRMPFDQIEGRPSREALGADQVVRANGDRLTVTARVVELADLTISHDMEGRINPGFPAELQPRDRAAAPSRTWVSEKAAALEPALLGRSPTAQDGAPIVGPDGVVESGNGRAMLIARAYDRHPDRAAEYRGFLEAEGFSTEGLDFPVLVRVRETPLPDRAAFAREANVATTAGLSASERAFADGRVLDDHLLATWRAGETGAAGNAGFVRAFADRIVAAAERPNFVSAENRLSAEGRTRIEAALVARGWGERDIVQALYENVEPTSKAILGAMADTAPIAARVKTAIAKGRVPAEVDPTPAIVAAFRVVERARAARQKTGDFLDQIDIETGAVPDAVKAAARLFFRDDAFRHAAGREVVAARIEKALLAALDRQNAVGDLFGEAPNAAMMLRGAQREGDSIAEAPILDAAETPNAAPEENILPEPAPRGSAGEEISSIEGIDEAAPDAEALAVLDEVGDFEIRAVDDDGNEIAGSARAAIEEVGEDAAATRELFDCATGKGVGSGE